MANEQRIEEFKYDLQQVLDKHKATISVSRPGDNMSDPEIEVYMEAIWSEGFEKVLSSSVTFFFESSESL